MSKFINDVEEIMSLFNKVDENKWSSKDKDGNLWVAILLPSTQKLIVSFKSKEESTPSTIIINKDERKKLFSTFRDLYSGDENHSKHSIDETCSAGATCAGSVSGFAKPIGKIAKRKKTTETFDSKLFKESIINDMPCVIKINEHVLRYFENNGKFYMGIDNSLVKTYDKKVMIESVDNIINNKMNEIELLENYSCYEMDILMEDVMANPLVGMQQNQEQDQNQQPIQQNEEERNKELLDMIDTNEEVYVVDDENNGIKDNMRIVGHDEETGNFAVKDNSNNQVEFVNQEQIKSKEYNIGG